MITYPDDLSKEDRAFLENYIKNGCPGLTTVNEVKTFQWFELYMSGKTYEEITKITGDRKDLIIYISHKTKWHEEKMKYYRDLTENTTSKLKDARYKSLDTVSTAVIALGKYFGDKFNNYLKTKDENLISNLDTKMLGQYYKSMELLDKITSQYNPIDVPSKPNHQNQPTININVGQGSDWAEIVATEDKVEINDKNAGEIIKILAKYKKSLAEESEE